MIEIIVSVLIVGFTFSLLFITSSLVRFIAGSDYFIPPESIKSGAALPACRASTTGATNGSTGEANT